MFARLGPWAHDHRKLVLGIWIAALVLSGMLAGTAGGAFRDEFNLPDVESKDGFDVLDEEFGGQGTGVVGTIVFRAEQGVNDPEVRREMQELFDHVEQIEDVNRVESPYDEDGDRLMSENGEIAYANVEMPDDISFPRAEEIRDEILGEAPEIEGVQMELGASSSPSSTSRRRRSSAWRSRWSSSSWPSGRCSPWACPSGLRCSASASARRSRRC